MANRVYGPRNGRIVPLPNTKVQNYLGTKYRRVCTGWQAIRIQYWSDEE